MAPSKPPSSVLRRKASPKASPGMSPVRGTTAVLALPLRVSRNQSRSAKSCPGAGGSRLTARRIPAASTSQMPCTSGNSALTSARNWRSSGVAAISSQERPRMRLSIASATNCCVLKARSTCSDNASRM